MQTIAEIIRKKYKKRKSPFEWVAEKYQTDVSYVRQIARGERVPVRGKGLKIKKTLERLAG
ncbi:XRE family transcriptional regulator [Capnocytophaga canis]|uniref:XRE family transcriptional regulator n=1 Tax=Capnocytophaga canis TaxID=1848903 RepID=UPI001562400D|nr:XRE family transcriptional regulator [Capnocytophaga canis]